MFGRVWKALGDAADRQTAHQVTEEPARRFIDLLGSALAGGFAHVADPNGDTPFPFAPWGWRRGGDWRRRERADAIGRKRARASAGWTVTICTWTLRPR